MSAMAASASAAHRAAENGSVGSTRLGLGRSEVEVPVHRLRVGAEDLGPQALGERDGQIGLSGSGRPGDDGERGLG